MKDGEQVLREEVIILELFDAETEGKIRLAGSTAHLLLPEGPQVLPMLPQSLPFSQATFCEARDDDGVKRLFGAGDGDAQGSTIALQLHCVADCPCALLLI